jgi:hypothetical protein
MWNAAKAIACNYLISIDMQKAGLLAVHGDRHSQWHYLDFLKINYTTAGLPDFKLTRQIFFSNKYVKKNCPTLILNVASLSRKLLLGGEEFQYTLLLYQ